MVTDNDPEEDEEEIDIEREEDEKLVHEDEGIVDDIITQNNDVDQLGNEEEVTVNNVNGEYTRTVNDDNIAGEASDSLMRNDEEVHEDKNISSRLIPMPLTTNHLNKYEREHQYLSFNKQINIKEKSPSAINQIKSKP